MANIYLKVSPYIAAFYRNRDEQNRLTQFQPVVFSEHDYEMRMIRTCLTNSGSIQSLTPLCYSQQAWNNILHGKMAIGGKTILTRDPKTWPSPKEVCALEGRALKHNEEIFDYLCIALPRETWIGSSVVKVDARYYLNSAGAKQLIDTLREEYYHFFYEWVTQEERMFRQRNIPMTRAAMMERFYAQYEIPMARGGMSRNTMNVQAKRLFSRGKEAKNRRTALQGEYFDYTPLTAQ